MLHTGLRVGEVVNLRLADLFLHEDRRPHLRVNGKGQRGRIVYLSAAVTQLLIEYLRARPAESGEQVFLNPRGKPNTVCRTTLQVVEKVGLVENAGGQLLLQKGERNLV